LFFDGVLGVDVVLVVEMLRVARRGADTFGIAMALYKEAAVVDRALPIGGAILLCDCVGPGPLDVIFVALSKEGSLSLAGDD
jgi:hypothetical protein